MMKEITGKTISLCPICLEVIPAARVAEGQYLFLEKTCPNHGYFKTIIWRGPPSYEDWGKGENSPGPSKRQTETSNGCPYDCGLCPKHKNQTCTVLMEVTGRCDLACSICLAGSGKATGLDPDLSEIRAMLDAVVDAGGPYPIQLSGGEPTLRDDLPEIVSLAKVLGFPHVQINTHGLRLAKDKDYLQKLKDAGTDLIYMQFDGVSDDVYRQIRGADLFTLKVNAIKNCAEAKIGVQLVPTIIPGINDHQIGELVNFAKGMIPVVKGIHFQPVSYFGRYHAVPSDQDRITIPDVLRAIEAQTGGEVKAVNFLPRRVMDSHCGFSGFFVLQDDNKLKSTTLFKPYEPTFGGRYGAEAPADHVRKFISEKSRFIEPFPLVQATCCSKKESSLNKFIERSKVYFLSISGMPFQDAWTVDLERLQGCCVHVIAHHRRLIPFCSNYLTNSAGQKLKDKGG